jgi:hypothetical protein
MWGEVRRVTVPIAGSVTPFAWSPGGFLTVASYEQSSQSRQRILWTVSADGTYAVREVAGEISPLALAPDGETLYAMEQVVGAQNTRIVAIALRTDARRPIGDVDRLGESAFGTPATPGMYFGHATAFAPDRAHLAVAISSTRTAGMPPQPELALVLVGLDGEITGSLRFPPGRWPGPFAWSPDSTMLAFGSSGGTLTIVDARGMRLFEAPFAASSLAGGLTLSWSPDSRWLAYAHLNGIAIVSPSGLPAYELAPVGGAIGWQPARER